VTKHDISPKNATKNNQKPEDEIIMDKKPENLAELNPKSEKALKVGLELENVAKTSPEIDPKPQKAFKTFLNPENTDKTDSKVEKGFKDVQNKLAQFGPPKAEKAYKLIKPQKPEPEKKLAPNSSISNEQESNTKTPQINNEDSPHNDFSIPSKDDLAIPTQIGPKNNPQSFTGDKKPDSIAKEEASEDFENRDVKEPKIERPKHDPKTNDNNTEHVKESQTNSKEDIKSNAENDEAKEPKAEGPKHDSKTGKNNEKELNVDGEVNSEIKDRPQQNDIKKAIASDNQDLKKAPINDEKVGQEEEKVAQPNDKGVQPDKKSAQEDEKVIQEKEKEKEKVAETDKIVATKEEKVAQDDEKSSSEKFQPVESQLNKPKTKPVHENPKPGKKNNFINIFNMSY
jgi:hypothetical protein